MSESIEKRDLDAALLERREEIGRGGHPKYHEKAASQNKYLSLIHI